MNVENNELFKLIKKNHALRAAVNSGYLIRNDANVNEFIRASDLDFINIVNQQNNALQSVIPRMKFVELKTDWKIISNKPISSCCKNFCINANPFTGTVSGDFASMRFRQ
uniref:Uncharacterized protein n=1 Tax=Meloidogyne javanica TaxID=6303 RepID=A0A915LND2_MELJA